MTTFKEKCIQYFDTSDLYEILKVKKDASTKESKLLHDYCLENLAVNISNHNLW